MKYLMSNLVKVTWLIHVLKLGVKAIAGDKDFADVGGYPLQADKTQGILDDIEVYLASCGQAFKLENRFYKAMKEWKRLNKLRCVSALTILETRNGNLAVRFLRFSENGLELRKTPNSVPVEIITEFKLPPHVNLLDENVPGCLNIEIDGQIRQWDLLETFEYKRKPALDSSEEKTDEYFIRFKIAKTIKKKKGVKRLMEIKWREQLQNLELYFTYNGESFIFDADFFKMDYTKQSRKSDRKLLTISQDGENMPIRHFTKAEKEKTVKSQRRAYRKEIRRISHKDQKEEIWFGIGEPGKKGTVRFSENRETGYHENLETVHNYHKQSTVSPTIDKEDQKTHSKEFVGEMVSKGWFDHECEHCKRGLVLSEEMPKRVKSRSKTGKPKKNRSGKKVYRNTFENRHNVSQKETTPVCEHYKKYLGSKYNFGKEYRTDNGCRTITKDDPYQDYRKQHSKQRRRLVERLAM